MHCYCFLLNVYAKDCKNGFAHSPKKNYFTISFFFFEKRLYPGKIHKT